MRVPNIRLAAAAALAVLSSVCGAAVLDSNAVVPVPLSKRQVTPATGIIRDFEVHPPVLTPKGTNGRDQNGCVVTQTLMVHQFASSYGAPYVGNYTPPTCDFNRVTINFTVTSQGRQFDRLALMYLGDYEVWRTSTAEPTTYGIVWTYVKEMQQYNALWREPQTLIFDLGNEVDSTYTGPYNTTLTATFFTVPDSPATADQILAISQRLGSKGEASVFTIPSDNASVAYTFPQNVERAVFSVSANGQIGEEFWYSNVFNEDVGTFNASEPLPGGGPWREVQVFIDGQLAGVTYPFPVIFTGGIVPGFWRPIVSPQAFDLREHEIDITPWLGHILDGKSHLFEIRVASVGPLDGHGGAAVAELPTSYWLVTGKIFLFLSANGKKTVASKPSVSITGPNLQVSRRLTKTRNGKTNKTLVETTQASRDISISATVNGQHVSWQQAIRYQNYNFLANDGNTQNTTQSTIGSDANPAIGYFSAYSYPLVVNQSYSVDASGDLTGINGTVTTVLDLSSLGPAVFPNGVQSFNDVSGQQSPQVVLVSDTSSPQTIMLPASALPAFNGSILNTTLSAVAEYLVTTNGTSSESYSFGTTSQNLTFKGTSDNQNSQVTELYERSVKAVNTSVVYDHETLLGKTTSGHTQVPQAIRAGNSLGEVAVSKGSRGGSDPVDEL